MEGIEEKFKIRTDKNNVLDLYLRNINDKELSITLFTINQNPSKKYELVIQKNFKKIDFLKYSFMSKK